MVTLPPGLEEWWEAADVERPLHVEVDHQQMQSFRWLVLLELLFLAPVLVIAVPLALVGMGALLAGFARRAIRRSRSVTLRLVHRASENSLGVPLVSEEQADACLLAVLQEADRRRLVVVERVEGGPPIAVWWGGQPGLQARPDVARDALLERLEGLVDEHEDGWSVTVQVPASERSLFRSLGGPGRPGARGRALADEVSVRCASGVLSLQVLEGGRSVEELDVPLSEILGIQWAPVVEYSRRLNQLPAALRIVTPAQTLHFALPLSRGGGRALAALCTPGGKSSRWSSCPSCGASSHGERVCACGLELTSRAVRNLSRRNWEHRR